MYIHRLNGERMRGTPSRREANCFTKRLAFVKQFVQPRFLLVGLLLAVGLRLEAASPIADKIESVGLFKNGLAAITRHVTFAGDSRCELTDLSDAVHGTFWLESTRPVVARVTSGIPTSGALIDTRVTIVFKDKEMPPLAGYVAPEEDEVNSWRRDYATLEGRRRHYHYYSAFAPSRWPGQVPDRGLHDLRVRTDDGAITVVDPALIERAEFRRGDDSWLAGSDRLGSMGDPSRPDPRPLLFLESEDGRPGPVKVTIRYLARGASWAPSYILELAEGDTRLTARQRATIRNELVAFADAELFLISGFPNVECAHIPSLMGADQSLQEFFAALSRPRNESSSGLHTQMVISSNAVIPQNTSWNMPLPDVLPDEQNALELHWESVGRLGFAPGETIARDTAVESCPCERVVVWDLPSRRNRNGKVTDAEVEQPWDCVRFVNPLPFPMTSAPVTFYRKGRFVAQSRTGWVSRGESCQVRLTKALNVRGREEEVEEEQKRQKEHYAGGWYWKSHVRGELSVINYRGEPVRLVIRRAFYGKFTDAEESPRVRHLKEGVYHVNRLNEMVWEIELDAGESRTLTYRYTILAS